MTAIADIARGSRRKPGFIAAMLHRLSGVALAVFLPMHFIVLGSALSGADALDSYLVLTHGWLFRLAEWGLVIALSLHMTLGLRVLAIEFLSFRERGATLVSACCALAFALGILFLLSGASAG